MQSLQDFIISIGLFINEVLLPFLFGLALLFFIWNAFRLLILKGQETDARESAKSLMLYSIGAFVFLVSIWGLVNLLVFGLGIGSNDYVVPDYMWNDPFYRENANQDEYCGGNFGNDSSMIDCR